ncbi:MAG: esterase family protein [Lachnospiraceae bacterium]|nr:esterase family protein [Lachnospiraceae bacterium]
MKYNTFFQALAFDRVLPYEGQVECLVYEEGKPFLQIKAPEADKVNFRYEEIDHYCTKDESGIWKTPYTAVSAMNYVQLIVDGVELITPMLPISYGYSRPYNYVELETNDDFYKIKEVPHGSVRREFFESSVTGEWESCVVYTPPGYDETYKTYPVLYLQHGHGENEMGWTAAGKVNFIMDNLIAEGKAVPFVIVMNNGMVQKVDEKGRRVVDFLLFDKYLTEDVIPFIEKKFRVGGKKVYRGMAGLSMGSLQTCLTGFAHPEMFDCLGVFSGFVTDIIQGSELDLPGREASANEHLKLLDDGKKFNALFNVFFRSMGDKDPFWSNFAHDDELLKEKGITQVRKVYDGTHDWNVWRESFRDFAKLIFKNV